MRRLAVAVALAVLVAGCGPRVDDGGGAPPAQSDDAPPRVARAPLPDAALVLVPVGARADDAGERVFAVEVAATNDARERGLMGRETLGPQSGMLFVYRVPTRRSFWMKDCLIGLDIAFLDSEGRVLKAATLPPGIGLNGEDVPSVSCEEPVSYVLEVAARRLAALGVGTGDLVDVRAAAEGVQPE